MRVPFCTDDRDFDNHDLSLQQGHFRVTTQHRRSTRLKDQGQNSRVHEASDHALLVVLVPEHRRGEAEQVLAQAVRRSELDRRSVRHTDVWSYDELLAALAAGLGDDPGLAQLRTFVEAAQGLDIQPFAEAELGEPGLRQTDLITVLDRATARCNPAGQRLLPSGSDEQFVWRRHLELRPGWTNLAVGLRHASRDSLSTLQGGTWLRVHRDTPDSALATRRLRDVGEGDVVVDETGHTWLPLVVPPGVAGAAIVDSLAGQIQSVIRVIGGPEPASDR